MQVSHQSSEDGYNFFYKMQINETPAGQETQTHLRDEDEDEDVFPSAAVKNKKHQSDSNCENMETV